MICIAPDIIEKLPKGCHDCPFAYYDELNGATFYCGISRWSINKQRKQKVRHKGCGLIDPDYNGDELEKPKRDPVPKEKTNQDIANEIIAKAKEISSTLREADDDEVFGEDEINDLPETVPESFDFLEDEQDGNENVEEKAIGTGQGMVD